MSVVSAMRRAGAHGQGRVHRVLRGLSCCACALIAACGPSTPQPSQDAAAAAAAREIVKLKAEVARLAAENEQLRQTPAALAAEIDAATKLGDAPRAQAALRQLVERYPASAEVAPSIHRVDAFVSRLRSLREEEQQVASLGFKALKVDPQLVAGEATLALRGAEISRTWKFDNYGSGWKYLEAEKGQQFVTARVTVTSTSKEVLLPGIAAYRSDGASLQRLGLMRYRFARWQDFGSYLGNHADYRNDFSHANSIPFSLGIQVPQDAPRPVYIVATQEGCHTRTYERLAQPPAHYVPGPCATLKPTLTVDDLRSGSLAILKRID